MMKRLRSLPTPSVFEKAQKLLNYFSKKYPIPGTAFNPQFPGIENLSAAWASNHQEYQYLLYSVMRDELKWMQWSKSELLNAFASISPKGWVALHEMTRPPSDPSKCFVAMWFKPHMDFLFTDVIDPAAMAAGYQAERVDRVQHNNSITDEILAGVRRGKFLIADFTGHRGGVYFEAGFAMGLGKQVIWLVRKDHLKRLHFDTRQYNFIDWEPGNPRELKRKLQLRIEATQGRGPL